jgi:hypothetical protein
MQTALKNGARWVLKGYSLVPFLALWLLGVTIAATGQTMEPEYGAVAMYGPPVPYFSCHQTLEKAQTLSPGSLLREKMHE